MKQYIKHALWLCVCMGFLQQPLHAGPMMDFCRKFVSKTAALGYWGLLSYPAISAAHEMEQITQFQEYITAVDEYNQPCSADFKKSYPHNYRDVQNILLREGLDSLDDYTVKVLTPEECDGMGLTEYNMFSVGNKIILLPSLALSNMDEELLTACLSHEMKHDKDHYAEKTLAVIAATPFTIHVLAKNIYRKIVPTIQPVQHPTIIRSLWRIPRAGAILGLAYLVELWHSRMKERDADASIRNSPKLARKVADLCKEYSVSESSSSALEKYLNEILSTHPPLLKRAAYLEQWAAEAEARKKE